MTIRVFDMGRSTGKLAKAFEAVVNRPDIEQYIRGRVDQFLLDLLMTGSVTMPDGEIVRLQDAIQAEE